MSFAQECTIFSVTIDADRGFKGMNLMSLGRNVSAIDAADLVIAQVHGSKTNEDMIAGLELDGSAVTSVIKEATVDAL